MNFVIFAVVSHVIIIRVAIVIGIVLVSKIFTNMIVFMLLG